MFDIEKEIEEARIRIHKFIDELVEAKLFELELSEQRRKNIQMRTIKQRGAVSEYASRKLIHDIIFNK